MPWSVRVGRGWTDQHMPPDVAKIVKERSGEKSSLYAYFTVETNAHLDGGLGSNYRAFHRRFLPPQENDEGRLGPQEIGLAGDEIRGIAGAFEILQTFLTYLVDPAADVVSLIFVNFAPHTRPLGHQPVRPDGAIEDLGELGDVSALHRGIQWFSASVFGSIEAKGTWSACDWAMLTCTRAVAEESQG